MSTYTTIDGDMLDAIAWRELGDAGQVIALIAANPHAARLPPRLPAGIVLTIPPRAPRVTRQPLRLWGGA